MAAAVVAAAAAAVTAAPRGADGAFSVRALPARDADGGGGAVASTPTPSGSAHRDLPSAVALDSTGAVYVAGTSRVAASTAAVGSSGVFLLKASPLGDVLWRTDVVSSGGLDALGGLVVAPSGVYLAVTTNGRYDGSRDAGDGSGGGAGGGDRAVASAADGESFYDGALLCFSPDAAAPPRWTYQNGTAAADAYTAVAVRPDVGGDGGGAGGSLVVAGWTRGAQFGAAAGRRDVVILELNVTAGEGGGVSRPTLAHGVQWGTAADEHASALAIAVDGTVYVAVQQTIAVSEVTGDAGDAGRTVAADGAADAASAGDVVTRDRLVVYALDGRLARRLAADGTVTPAMEVLAQSSFVAASMAAGAAGRVYAAGVASVADGRRDDALLALFNLTSPSSSTGGEAVAAAAFIHKAVVVWNESAPAASERAVSVMVERGGNVVLVGHVQDPSSGAVAPWVMVYDPLGRLLYEDAGGSAGSGGSNAAATVEPRSCALDIARTSFFCVGLLHGQFAADDAGAAAFGRYDWTVGLPSTGVTAASVGVGGGGGVSDNGVSGDGTNTVGGGVGGVKPSGGDSESGLGGFLSKRLNVVLLLVGAVMGGILLGGAVVGTLLAIGHRRRDADKVVAESYFADEDRGSSKGSGTGGGGSSGAAGSSASVVPGGDTAWRGSAYGSSSGLPALPTLHTASGAPSGAAGGGRPIGGASSSAASLSTAPSAGGMSRAGSARTLPRNPSAIDQKLVGSASFFSSSGAVPGGGRGRGGGLPGAGPLVRHATHSGAMPSAGGGSALSRIDSELSVGSRSFFRK